jgi:hypothetical protein
MTWGMALAGEVMGWALDGIGQPGMAGWLADASEGSVNSCNENG